MSLIGIYGGLKQRGETFDCLWRFQSRILRHIFFSVWDTATSSILKLQIEEVDNYWRQLINTIRYLIIYQTLLRLMYAHYSSCCRNGNHPILQARSLLLYLFGQANRVWAFSLPSGITLYTSVSCLSSTMYLTMNSGEGRWIFSPARQSMFCRLPIHDQHYHIYWLAFSPWLLLLKPFCSSKTSEVYIVPPSVIFVISCPAIYL